MIDYCKKSKLLLSSLLTALISSVKASGLPATYQVESNTTTLESLLLPQKTLPSCDATDYYWYQKSGPDGVKIATVESNALIMQADSIIGQNGNTHLAQGNVEAYKDNVTFNADYLSYDQKYNHVYGGGHVVLTKQYNVITGKWVDYYMDLDKGTMKEAVVYNNESSMYASGHEIKLLNQKQLQIDNGYMTSCDPKHPDWHFTSDVTTFDYQDSQGNARNARLYIESTPIINFPYFQFPLGERRSGFLTPEFGIVNSRFASGQYDTGVFVGAPYYWNMAPNYDMTFEPKFYSTDGLMLTDQFRYLSDNSNSTWYTEQIPQDMATGEYRYYYHLIDNNNITKNLSAGFDFNRVSDSNYFVNFGNFNSVTDNINLNQSFYTNYTPEWGAFGVKIQSYQVLQPAFQPLVLPIYALTPQVNFNVNPQSLFSESGGLSAQLHSQYTNFTSGGLQTGQRSVFYPSLTYSLNNQWGFIKPKFGWNYTNYQLAPFTGIQSNYTTVDRSLPITSLDTGLVFERPVNFFNNAFSQTLEPRLYYLYIPSVNQAFLPVFDTAPATYNINQLFSENRFVGDDRINMANDLTMRLNSKLISQNNGFEYANYGVGYRYFFNQQNPFLYGNPTQQAQLFLPQPNLIAELGNKWMSNFSSNLTYQYSTVYQTVDAYTAQIKYNPEPYKVINTRFSYQYNLPLLYYAYTPGQPFSPTAYENQYAIDISGQWPIYQDKWLFDGRTNYDFTYGSLLNLITGIEYNGGCWGVKGLYENYITNVNQLNSAFYLQFELKGVASVGNGNPTSDLGVNIPGYVPLQSTPGYPPITNIH
jgi:LPS-assembly protein